VYSEYGQFHSACSTNAHNFIPHFLCKGLIGLNIYAIPVFSKSTLFHSEYSAKAHSFIPHIWQRSPLNLRQCFLQQLFRSIVRESTSKMNVCNWTQDQQGAAQFSLALQKLSLCILRLRRWAPNLKISTKLN
jgi:hypothetical protein